jgi:hypothetical protein
MKWRSTNDEHLAGRSGDPAEILAAASLAKMVGAWDAPRCVFRIKGTDGRAVWVWNPPGSENLLCAAVGGWNEVWTDDQVDGRTFFASIAPEGWLTKARLGTVAKDWSTRSAIVWTDESVWCVGMFRVEGKPNARRARLCKVGRVEAGELREVVPEEGAPSVPIEGLGATRWIPQDAHTAGYARMWETGETESGSYMWHVIRAARLAGNPLAKRKKA